MTLLVGVLVSGRGTNLQAVLDACGQGPDGAPATVDARVVYVASNRARAHALERAARAGVPHAAFTARDHGSRGAAQAAMADALMKAGAKLVVHAGFDHILGPEYFVRLGTVPAINVHPALLPLFGGRGMYGARVHQAVLASKATESGATVHRVHPDTVDLGEVVVQRRIPVLPDDDAETLAARVLEQEHLAIVDAIRKFVPAGVA